MSGYVNACQDTPVRGLFLGLFFVFVDNAVVRVRQVLQISDGPNAVIGDERAPARQRRPVD